MSLVRAFAVWAWVPVWMLACSQVEDGVLLLDEADASAGSRTAEHAASPASTAANEVLARLDSHLAKMANAPSPHASSLPEPPAVAPTERPSMRLRREGAFLHVDAEAYPQTRRASVALPLRARDAFRIADEATRIEAHVTLKGASEAEAEVADGRVVYLRGIFGQGDIVHRPSALGTEDFILFDKAPPSERLEYEMALGEKVAGLRLVENVLELVDETGAPRLRVAPPYVIDAGGERHDAALSVEGCAVDTNPAGPWGREPVRAGASSCTVVVDWRERGVSYPAVVDPSWETTGEMMVARSEYTASLLSNGRVLVAGGLYASSSYLKSAELYDPSSGVWASTGSMADFRAFHSATLLDAKRVWVAGGYYFTASGGPFGTSYFWHSAEVYDADSGQWSHAGLMATGRYGHRGVRLQDGRVIVLGGRYDANSLSSAEIYDPVSKKFSSAGDMTTRREEPEALLLPDGRVFIVGGYNRNTNPTQLSSAEIYDPSNGSFTTAASIAGARAGHRAALLLDGRVLVHGGYNGTSYLGSGAIYDPIANQWASISSTTARSVFSLTLLGNGKALAVGGFGDSGSLKLAQLYDPVTNGWQDVDSLTHARGYHTATRLLSGDVLVAGGRNAASTYLSSSEIYEVPSQACALSSECASGFCVDGYCCDSACSGGCGKCNIAGSQGTCRPLAKGAEGSPSCSPYLCNGTTACPTSCTSDADCILSHVCSSGLCKAKSPNGSACSANIECQSGICNGGVCCDRACNGNCESCASGACSFVPAGTPRAGCGYFVCNGHSGNCPSSCVNDAQCRSDAFCGGGICQPKAAKGTACQKGGDCQSGFCADGVCCESACDGQCAQCNREGALGSCLPVVGPPLGGRPPCTSDGSVCGGSCDGASLHCSYPSAGSICAAPSCIEGVARAEPRCNGAGHCAPGESRHCAPYACGESDCKAACVDSTDCHPSAECVLSHCIGTLENGESCASGGECKSGHCANGVCCNAACDEPCAACNVAGHVGTCLAGADTSGECQGDEGGSDDWALQEPSGCGCRLAGAESRGGSHAALGGLGIVLAWTFRRRAAGKSDGG